MNEFEKILQDIQELYYGPLLMAVFEVIAIITGLLFVRKDKAGVLFISYLVFDFTVLLCDYYVDTSPLFSKKDYSFFMHFTNALVSFAELIVYYYFFMKIIQNKTITNLMKIIRIAFSAIMVVFVVTKFSFLTTKYSYVSYLIGALEFIFLLLPCFVYFFEILSNDPSINLYQRPSFWIVTGIFFYAVISVPYFLIYRFVFTNRYEHRVLMMLLFFYIPFTINFIFLTKAFLCRKPLTI